jgi:hypothetical protein
MMRSLSGLILLLAMFVATSHAAESVDVGTAMGETIYVPIYSNIYYDDARRTIEMAATLSIHNVNEGGGITLLRADYYDTQGKLLKKYVPEPRKLKPLETVNIVIEKSNTAGGAGANFIVQWQSERGVISPVVEAVMINTSSNLGIAFTSSGKVIKRVAAP